jgi:hypothetical protein
MRLNPSFIIFLLLICTVSCKPAKQKYQFDNNDFKSHTKLKGFPVSLDSSSYIVDLCLVPDKDLMLVTDLKSKDFINVYQLSTLRFIKSFIEKGIGPEQQIVSRVLQYDRDSQLIYSTDTYKKKIFVYSLSDIAAPNKKVYPVNDFTLQSEYLTRPKILPTKSIVDFHLHSKDTSGVLDIFSLGGALEKTTGSFPHSDSDYQPALRDFAFYSAINLSEDTKHILVNYFHTDYLEIYDISGRLEARTQGPDCFDPLVASSAKFGGTMSVLTKDSYKAYTGKMQMKGNEVLVLYDGKKATDDFHVSEMMLLDSKLNPVTRFFLNIPVFAIDVDWNTRTVYALSNKVKGKNLIKYKF